MNESESETYLHLEEKRQFLNGLLLSILKNVPSFQFRGLKLDLSSMMFDLEQPRIVEDHQHGDFEVTICEKGEYVNLSDGVISDFRRHDHTVLVMPPATIHMREYKKKQTFNFTFRINVSTVDIHEKRLLEQIQDLCAKNKFQFPLKGLCRILFLQFRQQFPTLGVQDPATMGLLAAAFLSSLFYTLFGGIESLPQNQFDSRDLLVEKIKNSVQRYLNGKCFSDEYLQKNFNLSANYLNRIFRSKTGMSVHNFWQQQRILQICSLIKNTNTKFAEISRIMGFCNPAQFSAYTRHHTGKSPSELRNKH